jgi:hypothetical protein
MAMNANNDQTVGYAAVWMAAANPQWLTSDEFAPAVVIHDRKDQCPECGTYIGGATCPIDHEEQ